MRPGLLPRRYVELARELGLRSKASMRPGLLPRRYVMFCAIIGQRHDGFNEAGAFAPEIYARAAAQTC